MTHVCVHTEEGKEACFACKRPMTKYIVSTFNGFNKFINNIRPGKLLFVGARNVATSEVITAFIDVANL